MSTEKDDEVSLPCPFEFVLCSLKFVVMTSAFVMHNYVFGMSIIYPIENVTFFCTRDLIKCFTLNGSFVKKRLTLFYTL